MKPRIEEKKRKLISRRIFPQFGPEVEFEVNPLTEAEARKLVRSQFNELQEKLVNELLSNKEDDTLANNLQQAASEAAALAWASPFPTLIFPTLLEEKAQAARTQTERQLYIQKRSESLLEVALCQ